MIYTMSDTIPLIERRKLVKSGTSVVLSIPREWLKENGLAVGDEVLMVSNGNLKFMKINKENVDKIRNQLSHSQAGPPATSNLGDASPS